MLSMGNDSFVRWLDSEVKERGWTFGELGRRAGLSSGMISKVMTEQARPGWNFCQKLGHALAMPTEDVFRRARLLPPLPPAVAEEREAMALFRTLPSAVRATVLTTLRALAGRRAYAVAEARPAYVAAEMSRLDRALWEAWEALSPEWQEAALEQVRQLQALHVRFVGEEGDGEKGEEERTVGQVRG